MAPKRTDILTSAIPWPILCRLFHGVGCTIGCGGAKPGETVALPEDQEPRVTDGVPTTFYCRECRSMTFPATHVVHYCIPYQGPYGMSKQIDVGKKKWNVRLQCWTLDVDEGKEKKEDKKDKPFVASSCEVTYKPSTSVSVYQPKVPWEGIDRKKWPATWLQLVKQYHSGDWWQGYKYISDADWDARLRGEYRPEPQRHYYQSTNYHGSHKGYEQWKNGRKDHHAEGQEEPQRRDPWDEWEGV